MRSTVVLLLFASLLPGLAFGQSGAADGANEAEYPDTLSLDGTWEIVFDPENRGNQAGWHREEAFSSLSGRRDIEVPSCWEEIEKDYETVQRWAQNPYWGGKLPTKDVLPVEATIHRSVGLWVCVSHVVTDHPAFDGLPAKCMMGQVYENVWAPQTLIGTGGEPIVASVSHDWHQGEKDAQNYLGPDAAWCGMDLGVVGHGQGRYVLSTMRIVENLGSDPVADKILFNLIEWTAKTPSVVR